MTIQGKGIKQIVNEQKILDKSYSVGSDFILLPSADPDKRAELDAALFNMKHGRNSDKDYSGNQYESTITNRHGNNSTK